MKTLALQSADGVTIDLDRSLNVASLRYFDAAAFSARMRTLLNEDLPPAQVAVRARLGSSGEECILLWRSPTETWLLCATSAPVAALERALADAEDCRLIPQTGGILALHVEGARTPDLLARLGSSTSMPQANQVLTGRLADITVTVFGVQPTEAVLLVERVYADHLLGWIRETLADFTQ